MKLKSTYHPRVKHSNSYYLSIAQALADGITRHLTDGELALYLAGQNLLSPSGNAWSKTAVSQALHKLRSYKTYPSNLHNQLLQLYFDGLLSKQDVLPLYQPRREYVM